MAIHEDQTDAPLVDYRAMFGITNNDNESLLTTLVKFCFAPTDYMVYHPANDEVSEDETEQLIVLVSEHHEMENYFYHVTC